MPSKIVQFQVDIERLADYRVDVAADWVLDPNSELYQKYKNLRKEDFLELMKKDGDENKMTKRSLIPIGVALVDKGNSSQLIPLVMENDEITPCTDCFGYLGVNLTREQIVDFIMDILKNGK